MLSGGASPLLPILFTLYRLSKIYLEELQSVFCAMWGGGGGLALIASLIDGNADALGEVISPTPYTHTKKKKRASSDVFHLLLFNGYVEWF